MLVKEDNISKKNPLLSFNYILVHVNSIGNPSAWSGYVYDLNI